ncbi:hypothetical protein ACFVFS_30965 [Kitasatospora sp. NPDC057692]|uniref:hypothetical protein n=1 Tax=Kitasatospora sp. NPDC057692 TaxID=3346215 RepID=UPI00369E4A24
MFNNGTPRNRAGKHQEKSTAMPETTPPEQIGATLPAVDRQVPVRTRRWCPKDRRDSGPEDRTEDRTEDRAGDRAGGSPEDRPGHCPDGGPRSATRGRPGRTRHRVITAVQIVVFTVGSVLGLAGGRVALQHGNGLQLFAASAFLFGAATVLQFFRPQASC